MRRSRIISLLLAICIIFSLTACTSKENNSQTSISEEKSAPKTVTDMTEQEIVLPEKVEHVYFDWASGITLAMTLGATSKVIAKPVAFEEDSFAWARIICPSINDVPTKNELFADGNIEDILSLEPDVVFTSEKDNVEKYTSVGLVAIFVKFNDYDSFKKSLTIVGTVLGESELNAANKYCKYLDDNISLVKERTKSVSDSDKKTVYYMDARVHDTNFTVGTGEIQEDWIVNAGGKLATAGYFEGRNIEITTEQLLEINPDIILVGAQNQAEVYNLLLNDKILGELSAVKNSQVFRIPQGIFPWCRTGPEAAIQVLWAGQFLHPELFKDIDIKNVAKDFYKEFFNADVSDGDLDEILSGHLCPDGK